MRLIILLVLLSTFAFAQTLPEVEQELARLGLKTVAAQTEAERIATQDTFATLLDHTIQQPASFNYAFDDVKNLSKLISPDNNFRIYTWSVPNKDGSFAFYGRLVLNKKNNLKVIKLQDQGDSTEGPEYRQLKASSWFGAMYYDMIKTTNKGQTYYTLLGYRPNRTTHNAKVLEVISTESIQPFRFGEKIFNTPKIHGYKHKRKPYRLIFRYNPKIVSTVKYIPSRKQIVMDHLAPPDASQMKQWHWYGPEFTFDALFWDKGMWQLKEDIALNNNIAPTTPQPTQKGLPEPK